MSEIFVGTGPSNVLYRDVGQVASEVVDELLFLQSEGLAGAVGIELKARLKPRKLLIPHNAKTAKTPRFAKARYTPRTRRYARFLNIRLLLQLLHCVPRFSSYNSLKQLFSADSLSPSVKALPALSGSEDHSTGRDSSFLFFDYSLNARVIDDYPYP